MELSRWHMWWKRRGAAGIRGLLMEEWDPIGVRGIAEAANEYDGFVGAVGRRLRESAPGDELESYLTDIRETHIGLGPSAFRRARDGAVAARLVQWFSNEMRCARPSPPRHRSATARVYRRSSSSEIVVSDTQNRDEAFRRGDTRRSGRTRTGDLMGAIRPSRALLVLVPLVHAVSRASRSAEFSQLGRRVGITARAGGQQCPDLGVPPSQPPLAHSFDCAPEHLTRQLSLPSSRVSTDAPLYTARCLSGTGRLSSSGSVVAARTRAYSSRSRSGHGVRCARFGKARMTGTWSFATLGCKPRSAA
jgi:hypothetical protein